jgi:hypothetical protein
VRTGTGREGRTRSCPRDAGVSGAAGGQGCRLAGWIGLQLHRWRRRRMGVGMVEKETGVGKKIREAEVLNVGKTHV